LWYAKNHKPACIRFAIALLLLACAPLVGLTLHTASEERRRLVKEWNQRSQEMMELATREEGRVIGQTRQLAARPGGVVSGVLGQPAGRKMILPRTIRRSHRS
jgi:hypothetical protein